MERRLHPGDPDHGPADPARVRRPGRLLIPLAAPAVALGLLAACTGSEEVPDRITSLQIVSVSADPCEQTTGQVAWVTATIADPQRQGARVAIWTCPGSSECWATDAQLVDGRATAALTSSGPGPLWVVACAPDVCDPTQLDEAERRDPAAWLATLPREGVAAAAGEFNQVAPALDLPPSCVNPTLTSEPVPFGAAEPGSEVTLSFLSLGAGVAFAQATGGQFDRTVYDIGDQGELDLVWTAPEEPGEVELFVVFVQTSAQEPFGVLPTQGNTTWRGLFTVL